MGVHIFNTYRFVLTNEDKQLIIFEGKKQEKDKAILSFNPKMSDNDLLDTLHNFRIVLDAAIGDLRK